MSLSTRLFPLITQNSFSGQLEFHDEIVHGIQEHISKSWNGSVSTELDTIDPLLKVVSICGLEQSGKKLLVNYLIREALREDELPHFIRSHENTKTPNVTEDSESTPLGRRTKLRPQRVIPPLNPQQSSPQEISRRRGIFFFLVQDPSRELRALLDDREFYLIDDELENMLLKEFDSSENVDQDSTSNAPSSAHRTHAVMIMVLRGVATFLNPKNDSTRTKDRIFRKDDPSLPDAVDSCLLHFAHLFSSQLVFNAPHYPHMHERDLATFASLLGLWNQSDRMLSWSRPETVAAPFLHENLSSGRSLRKSLRRHKKQTHTDPNSVKLRTLKPRLRNLSHQSPLHNSGLQKDHPTLEKKQRTLSHHSPSPKIDTAPKIFPISWSPTTIQSHEDYFRDNTHELSEFIYCIRDVSQLNPVNPERYLIEALLADPLSNLRRFNTITMRKNMAFLFPSAQSHMDNHVKNFQRNSDSDSSDEDEEDRTTLMLPSVEHQAFKGIQIFAPMHHAPHISNDVWREVCRPFKHSMARLKYYLYKHVKTKYFNGWPLTLLGLFCVAGEFVHHVNTKFTLPSIEHMSVLYEKEFILNQLEKKGGAFYRCEMQKLQLPCSQEEICAHHRVVLPKLEELIRVETDRYPSTMLAVVKKRVFDHIGHISEELSEELIQLSERFVETDLEGGIPPLQRKEITPLLAPSMPHNPHAPLLTGMQTQSVPTEHGSQLHGSTFQRTLTEAQNFELRNLVESRRKCRSIQYRIYARCVRSLKSYTSVEEYQNDFQTFLTQFQNHKGLGPAKDVIAQEFQEREQGKLKLLVTLLTKRKHYSTLAGLHERERFSSLNQQLERIEGNLQHTKRMQREEELMEMKRLDHETQSQKLIVFTETSTCEDQKMGTFSNRKSLIDFIDVHYSRGFFVHSAFFFKRQYGVVMRRYRTAISKEKIILCQSHELRSTIIGVWNEGFKLVHSICYDEIKGVWILVVRIASEPNRPHNCKFVLENNASELKSRVSRLCQKGFILTVCSISDADSLYFAYFVLPEDDGTEDSRGDALFLTGPFKYVTDKLSHFVKNRYNVKVCCGDKQGNWFIFALKSHSRAAQGNFLNLDHATDIQDTPTNVTQEGETFFKVFTYVEQAEEFVSDAWKTLSQELGALGSGGSSDD